MNDRYIFINERSNNIQYSKFYMIKIFLFVQQVDNIELN